MFHLLTFWMWLNFSNHNSSTLLFKQITYGLLHLRNFSFKYALTTQTVYPKRFLSVTLSLVPTPYHSSLSSNSYLQHSVLLKCLCLCQLRYNCKMKTMYLHNVIWCLVWSGTDTNKVLCSPSVYTLFKEETIYYHLLHKTKQHASASCSKWLTYIHVKTAVPVWNYTYLTKDT